MRSIAFLLLAAACCATGAASATTANLQCQPGEGRCPPLPPSPPLPPAPPVPPVPGMAPVPPIPPIPSGKLVPPQPPALPEVPAGAHRACAGKSAGHTLTYVIGKGETMRGTCESEGGQMRFNLESYHRAN